MDSIAGDTLGAAVRTRFTMEANMNKCRGEMCRCIGVSFRLLLGHTVDRLLDGGFS